MDAKKGGLGLVKSRRFGPLFATQFLGAFNDNVFKTALFVMIGFYGLGQNGVLPAGQMLNLGALLFILPYFLFSALSGQLGNKFDKAVLARWVKVLEIIIMAVAAYGFYIRSAPLLLLCLFCMGAQSTLFGPLKYAILPDYLDDNELMMGNSLIESGTFVAILFGQILGTAVAGAPPYIVGILVLLVAVGGTAGSLFMPSVPAKAADTQIELLSVVQNPCCVKRCGTIPFLPPLSASRGFGLSARFIPRNCRPLPKSIWAATIMFLT